MWVRCVIRFNFVLLCVAVIVCFALPASALDDDSYYYRVLLVAGDESTSSLQRAAGNGYTAFIKELADQGQNVRLAATFVRTDFGSSIRESYGQVVIVCFDRKSADEDPYDKTGGSLAPSAACSVKGLVLRKGATDAGETSPTLSLKTQEFIGSGFVSIPQRTVISELGLRHGETVSLIATKEGAGGRPLPTFYLKVIRRFEWPGKAGFQVPLAAYGGVAGKDGIAFSLLAPAFSWGGQVSFESDSFRHVGLGILVAPAILESPASGAPTPATGTATDAALEKPAFTLKRLAVGGYIDMSGYGWIGAGSRFDFTEAKDHKFLLFLVVGPDALSKLMSSSH